MFLRALQHRGYVSLACMNCLVTLRHGFAISQLLVVAFLNKGQICANATLFRSQCKHKSHYFQLKKRRC